MSKKPFQIVRRGSLTPPVSRPKVSETLRETVRSNSVRGLETGAQRLVISILVAVATLTAAARAENTNKVVTANSSTTSVSTATTTGTVATATAAATSTNEPTIVTAERSQLDYLKKVWVFEGNVLVVDPRITIRADKMNVYFGGSGTNQSGSIQKAVAEGGVVITQEEKKATGDHAEYFADGGKVVLTGSPQVKTPDGTVTGEKITFWRGSQKMDVEASTNTSPTRLIIYPDDLKHKEQ